MSPETRRGEGVRGRLYKPVLIIEQALVSIVIISAIDAMLRVRHVRAVFLGGEVRRQPSQIDGLPHVDIASWEARQRAGVVPSQARKAR